jgi:hypothetical protein
MDYKLAYDRLIEKRKNDVLNDVYYETHHIIPRCMGGTNKKSNLVRLTAREHYIAHHLLFRAYRTTKLAHAWFMMLRRSHNQQRFYTAKQYEIAALANAEALRESMKGVGNHFFNKHHSEESKKKISEKVKECYAKNGKTETTIANWIEKVAKKPKSKEHRAKIGRSDMIMLKNFDTGESVRVHKNKLHEYDPTVWKNPAVIQRRATCAHCGVESTIGNINRWHNDNCKSHRSMENDMLIAQLTHQ